MHSWITTWESRVEFIKYDIPGTKSSGAKEFSIRLDCFTSLRYNNDRRLRTEHAGSENCREEDGKKLGDAEYEEIRYICGGSGRAIAPASSSVEIRNSFAPTQPHALEFTPSSAKLPPPTILWTWPFKGLSGGEGFGSPLERFSGLSQGVLELGGEEAAGKRRKLLAGPSEGGRTGWGTAVVGRGDGEAVKGATGGTVEGAMGQVRWGDGEAVEGATGGTVEGAVGKVRWGGGVGRGEGGIFLSWASD
ncbi:hypothetical protein BDZ91DRAFT_781552 [Kalaharituber pfeilii]|nr:hypothetical protein BDZ91DRAFT_781552 [Kalaharituber pfeilii]